MKKSLFLSLFSCSLLFGLDNQEDVTSLENALIVQQIQQLSATEQKFACAIEDFERLADTDSFELFLYRAQQLHDTCVSLYTNVDKNSRMARALKLRLDFLDLLVHSAFTSEDQLIDRFLSRREDHLSQFAIHPSVSGLELRQEIFENASNSLDCYESFKEFIAMMEDDPLVVLGITPIENFQILRVDIDREQAPVIVVSYRYQRDRVYYYCEISM